MTQKTAFVDAEVHPDSHQEYSSVDPWANLMLPRSAASWEA